VPRNQLAAPKSRGGGENLPDTGARGPALLCVVRHAATPLFDQRRPYGSVTLHKQGVTIRMLISRFNTAVGCFLKYILHYRNKADGFARNS
jgi:hypothetical protein